MHTVKLLLTYYLNISVQVANLSNCRIESNRNFFARIGMLYCTHTALSACSRLSTQIQQQTDAVVSIVDYNVTPVLFRL